jgi:hypothetical protein
MKNILMIMVIAAAAFVTGCAATLQARHVDVSGFLGEYRSELREGKEVQGVQEAKWVYRNDAALKRYHKMFLAPVTIWDDPKHPLNAEQRNDYLELADSFHATLYEEFSKNFEMVDTFQPDTMRVQIAIIHGEKRTAGLSFISRVIPQARAANLLWTFATGKPAFTGSVDIEFKVTDADTGELLWAGADRRVGGQKLIGKNALGSWGDAKNAFIYWAASSAYRVCEIQENKDCVKPPGGLPY